MGCCQITRLENIEVNISTLQASERYTQNYREILLEEDELRDLSLESLDIRADDIKNFPGDDLSKFTTLNSCEVTQKLPEPPSALKNSFDLECALGLNNLKRKNADVLFNCANKSSFTHDIVRKNSPGDVRNSSDFEHSTYDRSYSLSLNFKPSLSIFPTPRSSFWMLASRSESVSSSSSYQKESNDEEEAFYSIDDLEL